MEYLKEGDKVLWSGNFGALPFEHATIIRIERTIRHDQNWGKQVDQVSWDNMKNCIVELDSEKWVNYKWAYGYQLRPITPNSE